MNKTVNIFSIPVLVAALGYFVDIYDLVLFSIIRKPSLEAIGIIGEASEKNGLMLLNIQMIGMLIGGLFWGILGDKKGRLSVLFGSIILYSLTNILNAFVSDLWQYSALRFLAGVGLAGELGAGITLVCELLDKKQRGWGTTIVATIGVSGAIFAGLIGHYYSWKICYIIGGVLGFLLLFLRMGVFESGMYQDAKKSSHALGDIKLLFLNKSRLIRYVHCILIGLPIWYAIGILITLSPELGKALHLKGEIKAGTAVMYCYAGVTLGDLASGVLSQLFKSRKKILLIFVLATLLCVIAYFQLQNAEAQSMYWLMCVLGFAAGYWAVLITSSSEQFGTNMRATVTTSVPNFIRGSLVPISFLYLFIQNIGVEKLHSALLTGVICCVIALWSTTQLKETFGHDLNFIES
ncbi:MAG: MFS transporter [Chitinophagaceae bacterium]